MESQIILTIGADGSVKTEVTGVTGPSCKALSRPYTSLFDTEKITYTPEYSAVEVQTEKQVAKAAGGAI